MNNLFNEIINTPATMAALISGLIAIIGVIIQAIVSLNKYNNDEKTYFEETLKEKLEKIYSPLIIMFSKSNDQSNLLEDESIAIINKYGYLLSKEVLGDLKEIYGVEKSNSAMELEGDSKEEYIQLKIKTINKLNREFNDLQSIYNKNFYEYKNKFSTVWIQRLLNIFKNWCIGVTFVFYVLLIIGYILDYFMKPLKPMTDNAFLNGLYVFILLIIIFTTVLGGGYAVVLLIGKFIAQISKQRKLYAYDQIVPQTGIYKCRVCGNTIKLVKNSVFPVCHNHTIKQELKNLHINRQWHLI